VSKQFTGMGNPEADVVLKGDNWGWGWNTALHIGLADNVKLGLTYRSEVNHSIDNVDFTISSPVSVKSDGTTDIVLPRMAYAGIAWNVVKPLTLEFDVQWTEWSAWDKIYVHLTDLGTTKLIEKDYDDDITYRFGANYAINDMFDVRAGVSYSDSIIPATTLDMAIPGGDRWTYNFGVGGHFGGLTADLTYTYLTDGNRVWNNTVGDYFDAPLPYIGRMTGSLQDSTAHLVTLTMSYKF